jgi:hypothetical protein
MKKSKKSSKRLDLKGRDAREWGYNFEEYAYNLIKYITPNVHTNIKIPHEVDIIFHHNKTLYLVECKRRKGYNKKGKTPLFFIPQECHTDLWFDGKQATRTYLGKLLESEQHIKSHRIYKAYGKPRTQTVLLIDGLLKIGHRLGDFAFCRDTYIITKQALPIFLKSLDTPLFWENKSSTGNVGVSPT